MDLTLMSKTPVESSQRSACLQDPKVSNGSLTVIFVFCDFQGVFACVGPAGVVNEYIQSPELAFSKIKSFLPVCFLGDIRLDKFG